MPSPAGWWARTGSAEGCTTACTDCPISSLASVSHGAPERWMERLWFVVPSRFRPIWKVREPICVLPKTRLLHLLRWKRATWVLAPDMTLRPLLARPLLLRAVLLLEP